MRKFLLALTVLSIPVSSGAFAQQQRSGTPEEQKACTRDVQKFCRPVIDQGDFTILACLQGKSLQDQRRLRPGSQEQRSISRVRAR